MENHSHTNQLIHETSPYLLQHAHNPVDWMPWGEDALELAKKENKPIIVSIGYAACHWCHVMEHESFEDTIVANLMNENFICIKVDREERPDVDQLYMSAVHLLSGQGGWPLNVVTLPDGRPFWGGTYFPKDSWMNILTQISDLYKEKPSEVLDYADRLSQGIKQAALIKNEMEEEGEVNDLIGRGVKNWQQHFDADFGGNTRSPKFMMPNNLTFLLQYGHQFEDVKVLEHVNLTLKKMAFGGVYDQAGGGFARYSVDAHWKVPHFEKMLYDNGQLISLYAKGYQKFKEPMFKRLVYQTVDFIERELSSPEGFFYSSLDADSEGEEGKFYVWGKAELETSIGEDFILFSNYYNVNETGYWEEGKYILLRTQDDASFAKAHEISIEKLLKKVDVWNSKLLKLREKKMRPGLDDKCLTSWNAIMGVGLLDAYTVFADERFIQLATRNAEMIHEKMRALDGNLFHSYKNGKAKINGFLEDYAHVVQLFIRLFETSGDEIWFERALRLMEIVDQCFWDENAGLYTFNNQNEKVMITHQYEVFDNVIPASNSVMANNLFRLGHIAGQSAWVNRSKQMMLRQIGSFPDQFSGLTNWGILGLNSSNAFYEVAIVGKASKALYQQASKGYWPNAIFVTTKIKSKIPLFEQRYVDGETLVYVCENQVCQLPVSHWGNAEKLLQKK